LSRQIKKPGLYQISAKTYNLTPQIFAFGATLSPTKRNQINQVISRMRFNGEIEPIIKRWNAL
jgi:ABC-type amino acid transport substrate-binding protein